MTDSTADRSGDERPDSRNRNDGPKRDGAPRNSSSRPQQGRSSRTSDDRAPRDSKPWQKSGDRASSGGRSGSYGDRTPRDRDGSGGRPQRSGERKPWDRDGGSRPQRSGERKSWDRDGERRPARSGGAPGERKPWDRDGGRPGKPGERKPWDRDGERRPARSGGGKPGERKPWDRDDRGGHRRSEGSGGHERREYSNDRPGDGAHQRQIRPRHDDPIVPEHIKPSSLDRSARIELKTLTKENADWVAEHLAAAAEFLETDPELAHRHALSASRRGGRIGVVRESLAITAYATGDFALALRELRTYRRITGSNDQLPLMVDSERGVGRPDRALELGRSVDRSTLPAGVQVSLAIAMSGARLDQGDADLALAELEIPQLDPDRAFSYSPALFLAYAEVLGELGREGDAERWRALAGRAEAALAGPAEEEVFEVFELDDEAFDVEVVEVEASEAPDAPVADATAAEQAESAGDAVSNDADADGEDAEAEAGGEGQDAHGAVPNEA